MKKNIFRTFILIFIFSSYLIAQQKDVWTSFTTANGLAGNFVTKIIQSSDGSLWFAAFLEGISCFKDGIWTTFTHEDGLVNDNITAICESSDGSIWFGASNGVGRYYQGSWTKLDSIDGFPLTNVNSIYQSSDGALWLGTFSGVICINSYGKICTTFTQNEGLINDNITAICQSSDGALWFGTTQGVSRYFQGDWESFTGHEEQLPNNNIQAICASNDGKVWFGTFRGVACYDRGDWTQFNIDSGLIHNNVFSICRSSDNTLWFGTYNGVSRYYKNKWYNVTSAQGLIHDEVHAIIESSDEMLWFGTAHGVSRYEREIWVTFTETDGLAKNIVRAMVESSDGALWFGTGGGGVSRYDKGIWKTYNTKNSQLSHDQIGSICESADDALWFGTHGGGVNRFDYNNNSWTIYNQDSGLANNYVSTIFEASNGAMWFGISYSGGISRYYNNNWTHYNADSGLVDNNITAICESPDGTLWFGTSRGLSRFYNGIWDTLTIKQGLIDSSINEIYKASDNALWFATSHGVSRYFEGNWTNLTTQDGLIEDAVTAVCESSDGAMWFGTMEVPAVFIGGGISRYYNGDWLNFTAADGLANNSVYAIIESSDGAMWLGTNKGVSRLKPDKVPPFTFITEGPKDTIGTSIPMFIINGKDYRTKEQDLYFSYAVTKLFNNIPPDPNSLSWSPFSLRTVIQPELFENGDYLFYVRVKDLWGNIDTTPATWKFKVDVTPPTITVTSPRTQDIVAGEVAIIGSAYDNSPIHDFLNYQLSYARFENASEWLTDGLFYKRTTTDSVRNDTLAIWKTADLSNGVYWLHLMAQDKLGHISNEFVSVEIVTTCQVIDARSGGYLCTESQNIEIYFPPNAIPRDQQIYVKDTTFTENDLIQEPHIHFIGRCFKLAPANIELLKPATLTMSYSDSLIKDNHEEKLAVFYFSDKAQKWQRMGGTINLKENKITTSFRQSGIFALYEDLTVGTKAGILNINSQPRIFSPQGGGYDSQTAISFELGKESNVTIKIYNPAGRLVLVLKENEPMSHGNNVVYWDGKDEKGDFCLSGLYIVSIQADEKMATKTVVVLNK